jgi:beta-lactam-binding protein with PASTA domain
VRRVVLIAVIACVVAPALTGCGGEAVSGGDVVTVTQVETRTVSQPADVSEAPAADPSSTRPTRESAPPGGVITVPDVVGLDHQLAQDTMQAAGLYNLAEEDATGQGRALLWDRNWVVVAQSPPAGARVNADTTIILRSKKDGE